MEEISESSFTSAITLAVKGGKSMPERYILPPSQRPNISLADPSSTTLPLIDLSLLNHPLTRSKAINQIHLACTKLGFFQVINHGIPICVMEDALHTAKDFFHLPSKEKMQFASANVHEPVRYGTSVNHGTGNVFCWRDFMKHYSNPISEWIHLWPSNPPDYRQKMGSYAKAAHVLQKQLMGVVMESLGMKATHLENDIEEGSQVMFLNYYPSCPRPDLALGLAPHTDHGMLTILNQNEPGLEIMDHDRKWHPVPLIQGALIVQVGDQIEVMSNGRYKGGVHRATLNTKRERISLASVHSLHIERKVEPIAELVDKQHPIAYKEGSFGEFLDYLSAKGPLKEKYIDTLKVL